METLYQHSALKSNVGLMRYRIVTHFAVLSE